MKKISTKELYLVYLKGISAPILARKTNGDLLYGKFTDVFTKKQYKSHNKSYDITFFSLVSAFPIITNLPYITEDIAHQIIQQQKFVFFDKNVKTKINNDSDFIFLLPLYKITGRVIDGMDRYWLPCTSVAYSDYNFYVLAKYIDEHRMEDVFTQTIYYHISSHVNVGECGYDVKGVREIDLSHIQDLENILIETVKEKNKKYYMDVEYPQSKVKKLVNFIKNNK